MDCNPASPRDMQIAVDANSTTVADFTQGKHLGITNKTVGYKKSKKSRLGMIGLNRLAVKYEMKQNAKPKNQKK